MQNIPRASDHCSFFTCVTHHCRVFIVSSLRGREGVFVTGIDPLTGQVPIPVYRVIESCRVLAVFSHAFRGALTRTAHLSSFFSAAIQDAIFLQLVMKRLNSSLRRKCAVSQSSFNGLLV